MLWIVLSNIITALCQFIIYRYIIKFLGIELMGVWSLVISATAIGQMSNFGLSNGLVKFIPELITQKNKVAIDQMVGTANVTNLVFSIPLLAALYFPTVWFAESLLLPAQLVIFKTVIPWCMISIVFNNLSSVFSFLLDGNQLFHTRAKIQSAGFVFFVLMALLLGAVNGLVGIAQALCCQSIFVLLVFTYKSFKNNITASYFPLAFEQTSFKQLFSFGAKFQVINLLNIFFDPLIKYFITKRFGLSSTALYEIANKIVMQARNLLVSTNQVVTPKVAVHKLNGTSTTYISAFFEKNCISAVTVTFLLLALSPYAGYYFMGNFNPLLQKAIIIITTGWFINMLSAPLYFAAVGLGKIYSIISVHFVQSLLIVVAFLLPASMMNNQIPFIVPAFAVGFAAVYLIFLLSDNLILLHKKLIVIIVTVLFLITIVFYFSAVYFSFVNNLIVTGISMVIVSGSFFLNKNWQKQLKSIYKNEG